MPTNEENNRSMAEQRFNAGKDPGGAYGDLSTKYANQQIEKKAREDHDNNMRREANRPSGSNTSGSNKGGCLPLLVAALIGSIATIGVIANAVA